MNKALITLAFLLTLLISSTKTFAWGSKGHALVAEVAFNYMDENTKKEVLKYLNGMTIEEAANWMDDERGNSYYNSRHRYGFAG